MTSPALPERDALQSEARRLESEAAALGERYARTTWLRFAAVFFPVPFVVVLLRYELAAWHYYLAGAAYVVFAWALFEVDTRLSEQHDRAVAAAERARRACGPAASSG